jgi:hypothetical protein
VDGCFAGTGSVMCHPTAALRWRRETFPPYLWIQTADLRQFLYYAPGMGPDGTATEVGGGGGGGGGGVFFYIEIQHLPPCLLAAAGGCVACPLVEPIWQRALRECNGTAVRITVDHGVQIF